MPPDQTIDKVLLIISGGLLIMGLGSALLGWILRTLDRVKGYPIVISREAEQVSEVELVRTTGSTGSSDPVRWHQNQVEPIEPAPREPDREPIILHNLSRSALIALLAVQKNDDNGYRFSKNQIAAFVGGTKADVLREIDQYRQPSPIPKPSGHIERPANGWN